MNLIHRARAAARQPASLMAAGLAAGTAGLALMLGPAALADSGPVTPVACSADTLSRAVYYAQSGEVLALAPGCSYDLDVSLEATVSLTIRGNGDTITTDTSGLPLVIVDPGTTVSLNGLTLMNGAPAIANYGTLTVTGSTFTGNDEAIANNGTLTVTGSTFTRNIDSAISSGSRAYQQASLTVTGSTFSDNNNYGTESIDGAAISITSTPATLRGDVFTDNTALSGGAIFDFCNGAARCALTITGSTFSGNNASYDGGAIENEAPLTLTNSTLSGNAATGQDSGLGGGYGGGLHNFGFDPSDFGTATLTNTVITGNTAGVDGGGIADQFGGTTTLTRSPVQSNTPDNCAPTGTIAGCTD